MNHLVVTADDFGLSLPVNEAVEQARRSGILSATSLMVGSVAAADAVQRAKAMPSLRVGLHLVLVEAKAVLPRDQIPDLVDERGFFHADMAWLGFKIAALPHVRRQMRAEIRAQFEAYRATGLPLDHVNAHRHFHLHPWVAPALFEIGADYGMRALRVPFEPAFGAAEKGRGLAAAVAQPFISHLRRRARRAGLTIPDAVFGLRWSGAMTTDRMIALLRQLPPGLIEIYTHPATADEFAGCAPGYRYRDELAALTAAESIDALRRSGRPVGGFSDVRP